MDFKTATDRITGLRVTLEDVAVAVDREASSVAKARLDPESPGFRSPPDGWQRAVAKLARERAADLTTLAEQLEGAG